MRNDVGVDQMHTLMVAFYFFSIPYHLKYVDLRREIKVCRILLDVFVSRNKNARGQLFGFACLLI